MKPIQFVDSFHFCSLNLGVSAEDDGSPMDSSSEDGDYVVDDEPETSDSKDERFSPRRHPRRATQPVFPNFVFRDAFRNYDSTKRVCGDALAMISSVVEVVVSRLVTAVAEAGHEAGTRTIKPGYLTCSEDFV